MIGNTDLQGFELDFTARKLLAGYIDAYLDQDKTPTISFNDLYPYRKYQDLPDAELVYLFLFVSDKQRSVERQTQKIRQFLKDRMQEGAET